MNKWLATTALFTGLMSTPLATSIEAKNKTTAATPRIEKTIKIIKNDVLFTIDDWPSTYMVEIAKTLDSLHYQWIFYIVTKGVTDKTKQSVIEVLKMWHHIWNHSFSHLNFNLLSIAQAKKEILVSDSIIASLYQEAGIPREKKYIRYPYGNEVPRSYREEFNNFLDSLGYEEQMFRHMDVDLEDWQWKPSDKKISKIKENDTILLHEKPWTVESIEKIVKNLENKSTF